MWQAVTMAAWVAVTPAQLTQPTSHVVSKTTPGAVQSRDYLRMEASPPECLRQDERGLSVSVSCLAKVGK